MGHIYTRDRVARCFGLFVFTLMRSLVPLTFIIFCVSTPFRLLAERYKTPPVANDLAEGHKVPELADAGAILWLDDTAPGVTKSTTGHPGTVDAGQSKKSAVTDKPE